MEIFKSSGERAQFSIDQLRSSLKRTGADDSTIDTILTKLKNELYEGISTREIHNRTYSLLKKTQSHLASKYKLKKSIYELGPTGYPFEKFVAEILKYSGYQIKVGNVVAGKCVSHEVDVIASKDNNVWIIECKFHGDQGSKCGVKIPLYIKARFEDIEAQKPKEFKSGLSLEGVWLITNTRFTIDAEKFGICSGLKLISWDYPINNALKDMIDNLSLYPITVSTILTGREKQFLLSRDVVLCKQLIDDSFYMDHLGISDKRQNRIIKEISALCKTSS